MMRLALGLGLLLAAGAVQAQDQAAPDKPKKVKSVCRRDETTGSRMAKSVCRTPDEWAAIDAANQGTRDKTADQSRTMKSY